MASNNQFNVSTTDTDNAIPTPVMALVLVHEERLEKLDKKYRTKDASLKKFVIDKFLDYKMVDSKSVMSQVQGLQIILFAMIEKLPLSWKDFKNYLKHKRKEMKLEDLIIRLPIEDDN
ncbi:hypothetical protein CDL12_03152 [Handroanthus impetiginosus]|uniref:Uncharacterized protein n=1 Tax=Handroanthus impetiginosus TaxID=429701 RepID=A0A2G9I2Z6_9LAMI|nr:hypothetical protein CDL12_03152 [Handroanthus impetiginosus]